MNSVPGTPSKTPSRGSSAAVSRPGTAGGGGARPQSALSTGTFLGTDTGVAGEPSDLTKAVLYVLECRRSVPREELAEAATAVAEAALGAAQEGGAPYPGFASPTRVASSSSSSSSSSSTPRPPTASSNPRPASARATLCSPIAATLGASGAGGGGANAAVEAVSALAQGNKTPWVAVYVGSTPRYRLCGLLPNGNYEFRVTALGRHAFSNPTKVLHVHLPPLAPFAPSAVRLGPRSCALRWYPGALCADKYEVQCKIVEALAPPGSGAMSTRRENDGSVFCGRNVNEAGLRGVVCAGEGLAMVMGSGGGGGGGTPHAKASAALLASKAARMWDEDVEVPQGIAKEREGGWAAVYTGKNTYAAVNGLLANTVYRFRVVAFSVSGTPSRPSHETQLVTLDSSAFSSLTPATAGRDFVVLCRPIAPPGPAPSATGNSYLLPTLPIAPRIAASGFGAMQDVVVGDTIVWTEDVWIDGSRPLDPYHPAPPREVEAACPTRRFLTSRTIAAVVIGDSSSKLSSGTGSSANVGGEMGPMPVGAMQHALRLTGKMPYLPRLTAKKAKPVEEGGRPQAIGGSMEEILRARTLTLCVEWCTLGFAPPGEDTTPSKHLRASHGPDAFAAAHPHLYQKTMGSNIIRMASDLASLDMFRMPWRDEEGRWSLLEELGASFEN